MSFKYKSIKRPDGNLVKTPSIPIVLTGRSNLKIEFIALIDSGASSSILHPQIARALGFDIGKLP